MAGKKWKKIFLNDTLTFIVKLLNNNDIDYLHHDNINTLELINCKQLVGIETKNLRKLTKLSMQALLAAADTSHVA